MTKAPGGMSRRAFGRKRLPGRGRAAEFILREDLAGRTGRRAPCMPSVRGRCGRLLRCWRQRFPVSSKHECPGRADCSGDRLGRWSRRRRVTPPSSAFAGYRCPVPFLSQTMHSPTGSRGVAPRSFRHDGRMPAPSGGPLAASAFRFAGFRARADRRSLKLET